MEPTNTLIITLTAQDVELLKDALNSYPVDCPVHAQDHVQAVWERLEALDALTHASAVEWLRKVGMGPYKGRPQG